MRSAIVLSALAALILATASTARADVLRLHHKPFSTMNRQEKISYLKRQKWHDKSIIRWWHHHRELADAVTSSEVRWATNSLKIVKHNLHQLLAIKAVAVQTGGSVTAIICRVFGAANCGFAKQIAWNESRYQTSASNGTHWGLFQLDQSALSTYAKAGYSTAYQQVLAAFKMFSVRGWEPWTCCE